MPVSSKSLGPVFRSVVLAATLTAVSACAPQVATRGNLPDPELLAEVVPGEIIREEVAEILGSPSSVTAFDSDTWVYMSERTETVAFFEPEVVERQIILISFDKEGLVDKVRTVGLEEGKRLEHVERVTPTAGTQQNALEQMLGNMGRFNTGR